MLARSLKLSLGDGKAIETPLLVPAFSSKVDPQIGLAIKGLEEYMSDPILVSAYDIHYRKHTKIDIPVVTGSMVFLDSGGYECSKDADLADVAHPRFRPSKWNRDLHRSVVDSWPNNIPTVITSYDHPKLRVLMEEQIASARELLTGRKNVLTEILLKPEKETSLRVKRESIFEHLDDLRVFDIVGITEKELGFSIIERMENIALVRREMDERGFKKPIHIFGSLDTIVTPLYFLAGADIFDGLTWLRYAFVDGLSVYEQDYGALKMPIDSSDRQIRIKRLVDNIAELHHLKNRMQQYLLDGDFGHFKRHTELFESSYALLCSKIGSKGREV